MIVCFQHTQVNGWKFWPFMQFLNQYFVPLQYRNLFMDLCSFMWDMYYSVQVSTTSKQIAAEEALLQNEKDGKEQAPSV